MGIVVEAVLNVILRGIAWTIESDVEYNAAYPEQAVDYSKVTEMEILFYTSGPCYGSSSINWTRGGLCGYCHRNTHTADEHKVLYPNAHYVD